MSNPRVTTDEVDWSTFEWPEPDANGHVCKWAGGLPDKTLKTIYACITAEVFMRAGVDRGRFSDITSRIMDPALAELQSAFTAPEAKQ